MLTSLSVVCILPPFVLFCFATTEKNKGILGDESEEQALRNLGCHRQSGAGPHDGLYCRPSAGARGAIPPRRFMAETETAIMVKINAETGKLNFL